MNDIIDDLKHEWSEAKKHPPEKTTSVEELISRSNQKLKSTWIHYVKNIAILTLTLVGITAFFMYVAPLENTLSHIGISCMLGGLLLRILAECYGIYRSFKMDMSQPALIVNKLYLDFHTHRKKVNGAFTISILLVYTVGFYLLIPEFSNYLSTIAVVLIAVSYLLSATIFGYFIRKSVRDEKLILNQLLELQQELLRDQK